MVGGSLKGVAAGRGVAILPPQPKRPAVTMQMRTVLVRRWPVNANRFQRLQAKHISHVEITSAVLDSTI